MEQKNNVSTIAAFSIVIGIILAASIWGILSLREKPIVLQGEIEAKQIRVSGKLPGRISEYWVEEGQMVKKGDTLVAISSPEALAKYYQVLSLENAAQAQNQKVDKGTRKQIIQSLFEAWQKSKADLALATKTHKRIQSLFEDGVVTRQKMDEVEALYLSAQAGEKARYYQYQLALDGAQKEDKEAAQSLADAAKGGVEQVKAVLSDSKLTAPCDAEVSQKILYPGELAGPGAPILSLVALDQPYAIINVREDLMPHFKMGKKFKADIPALALKQIEFKINFIKPLGSYATWRATRQSGGYDMKTFEIHALPTENQDGLRPGMTILTKIDSKTQIPQ
ncbi:HlyD family secretion protein [Aureibacter tunicatorum]|uniref:HlyD family secretion protein n=1 Tax=Aureibacter tunicatorum TaxID=866807 RepID=A0AAE3XJV7_9BACT|nr:biotin/lipoyl-binding protein [Aureibacter tunicatorum]MDR6238232.1 HlyD family secretion protein [Aureibacter tunicatorum]BDD03265.1 hemolysin secretion protein D [Aureibacter tunicatorum]